MIDQNKLLKLRRDAAKVMAQSWCAIDGNSQKKLAQLIGRDPAEVTRFCDDDDEDYIPTASRPAKVRLLEQIEAICGGNEQPVFKKPTTEQDARMAQSDYGATHLEHRREVERIVLLPAPCGLEELRTLKERALMDSGALRIDKLANVAYGFFVRLDSQKSVTVSVELLKSTYRRCSEVRDAITKMLQSDEPIEDPNECAYAGLNYIAGAIFHTGRLLKLAGEPSGDAIQFEGMALFLTSVSVATHSNALYTKRIRMWKNLFRANECYFAMNKEAAQLWLERAAGYANQEDEQVISIAVGTVTAPQIQDCISSAQTQGEAGSALAQLASRIGLVLLFVCAWMFAAERQHTVHDAGSVAAFDCLTVDVGAATRAEVNGDRTIDGEGDQTVVGSDDRTINGEGDLTVVGTGDRTIDGEGDLTVVGSDDRTINGEGDLTVVGSGDRTINGEGDLTVVGTGDRTIDGEGDLTLIGDGYRAVSLWA